MHTDPIDGLDPTDAPPPLRASLARQGLLATDEPLSLLTTPPPVRRSVEPPAASATRADVERGRERPARRALREDSRAEPASLAPRARRVEVSAGDPPEVASVGSIVAAVAGGLLFMGMFAALLLLGDFS